MKASKFETGFQQPKTGVPKEPVLTSLFTIQTCVADWLTSVKC